MAESAATYVANVKNAVTSIWEGMSVTLSHLFRRPITIQYPDRTPVPVKYMLPPRYRGFLEVDIDTCTACQGCERACPIQCIVIDIEKDPAKPKERVMTRFDIDEAKCMYCGLCVEPCPTGSIQHTREFEGTMLNLSNLVFRYVDPARPQPLYKPPKGVAAYPRKLLGEVVRAQMRAWDAPPPPFPPPVTTSRPATAETLVQAQVLAAKVAGADAAALARIVESAQAGTDCGLCTYPTCRAYAEAIASGKETRLHLCEPGGDDAAQKTQVVMDSWKAGSVVVTPEAKGARYRPP